MEDINRQSNTESPNKSFEIPTEIIEFSSLSKEDKLRLFNFFITNNTAFTKEVEGTYAAEIDMMGEKEKEDDEDIIKVENESQLGGQEFIRSSQKKKSIKSNKSNKSKKRSKSNKANKKNYDLIYQKLLDVIDSDSPIKGNKMNLFVLRSLIQEIYTTKFISDTQTLMINADAEPESFPVFVGKYLKEKYPNQKTLEKNTFDLILSIDFYSLKFQDIKIFQQFLVEEYDIDDLIYYLFLRSCIEKEMNINFIEKAKQDVRNFQGYSNLYNETDNDNIYIPLSSCKNIADSVFGYEEKKLYDNFLIKANDMSCVLNKKNKIKHVSINNLLNVGVSDYHNLRHKNDKVKEDKKSTSSRHNDEDIIIEPEIEKVNLKKKESKRYHELSNANQKHENIRSSLKTKSGKSNKSSKNIINNNSNVSESSEIHNEKKKESRRMSLGKEENESQRQYNTNEINYIDNNPGEVEKIKDNISNLENSKKEIIISNENKSNEEEIISNSMKQSIENNNQMASIEQDNIKEDLNINQNNKTELVDSIRKPKNIKPKAKNNLKASAKATKTDRKNHDTSKANEKNIRSSSNKARKPVNNRGNVKKVISPGKNKVNNNSSMKKK